MLLRLATTTELKEVLKDLHKDKEFQKVKKDLEVKGYKLAEEKTRGLMNETKEEYSLWLRWESSISRAVPLLIDDGYSTGGGGTDIFVFYDPYTQTLIIRVMPPELVGFFECFADCMVTNYGLIAAELLLLVLISYEYCIDVCTGCIAAPSFGSPLCWGCGLCLGGGAAIAVGGAYATYQCVSQCRRR